MIKLQQFCWEKQFSHVHMKERAVFRRGNYDDAFLAVYEETSY